MALPWQMMDLVRVPSWAGGYWTLVQDFVPGSRLLRLRIVNEDLQGAQLPTIWSPADGARCGPDGDPTVIGRTGMLCSSAGYGALVGKIGGSTADLPDSTAGSSGPYAGKKVFAVGAECIVSLSTAADGGPLFLTMNDKPEDFPGHTGDLFVFLQYYPL